MRWPALYPNERPQCCWHGTIECVSHIGWSHYPRRCYARRGNVALFGRRYRCTVREAARKAPFTFFSYATPVLKTAPAYVQGYWRNHGFRITHKASVAWEVVDSAHSLLANGAGAAGTHSRLIESYKQTHAMRRKMWRGHTDSVFQSNGAPRTIFLDFNDLRSELRCPLLGYLLCVTLEEIESKMAYYNRKMQMVFGRNLSADHSHKVAKVVLIKGERGFDGIYMVMNKVGKILAFYFVSGMTLAEVEASLRRINNRFKLHGLQGPVFFTTDQCCNEREFFAGTKNNGKSPIFDSLMLPLLQGEHQPVNNNNLPVQGGSTQLLQEMPALLAQAPAQGPHFVLVAMISLPSPPIVPSTLEIAEVTASDIICLCHEKSWDVIAVDSEWAFGIDISQRKAQGGDVNGPDTTQIGLPDGSTYVFLVRQFGKFPHALRQLLENADIKKVAHKIRADKSKLSAIGIHLNGEIELSHLAKQQGVVRIATCALSEIVTALVGCQIDKNPIVRLCDWGKDNLSEEEIKYAAIDAYAHMMAYLKIISMPYVDPTTMPKSKAADLVNKSVLLYTKNMNCVVASGTVVSQDTDQTLFGANESKTYVQVRLSRGDIRQLGAIVSKSGNQTFQDLIDKEEMNGFITVSWKVSQLRFSPQLSDKHNEVSMMTATVNIPVIPPAPADVLDANPDPGSTTNEQTNKDDNHKGVKQDIEHIFLRFSRLIKKSHGAFGAFMARLSDAFFVPSQADIAFIKEALRKSGLDEAAIKAKGWRYFKRRV